MCKHFVVNSSILHPSNFENIILTLAVMETETCRKDFEDFADLLFSQFGDRVKNWITINEPWGISYLGYVLGVFAPGRCSGRNACLGGNSATEPYLVTHNQLLSHSAVVKLYKEKYQVMSLHIRETKRMFVFF